MLKFILPFSLILPVFSNETVLYHFDTLKRPLPSSLFVRYVRPQIKNIVNEYFTLLKEIEPVGKQITEIRGLLKPSDQHFKDPQLCSIPSEACLDILRKALTTHYAIDKIVAIILQSIVPTQRGRSSSMDSTLIFRGKVSEFLRENLAIIQEVEEMLLLSHTPYQTHTKTLQDLHTRRYALRLHFDQLSTLLLPTNISDDFTSIYLNFIKPLDRDASVQGGEVGLMGNLEKLNNLWNAFHMKMTKSSIKIGKRPTDIIASMHRHWNSVLKIVLQH